MPQRQGNIWILKSLGVIFASWILAQLALHWIIAPIVEGAMVRWVHTQSKGTYELASGRVSAHMLGPTLIAKDLHLRSTPQDSLTSPSIEIVIPYLALNLDHARRALFERSLSVHSLFLKNPRISIRSAPIQEDWERPTIDLENWYGYLAPFLRSLRINEIRLENGEVSWNGHGSTNGFRAEELFLLIQDFKLDSNTVVDPQRPFYAEDISLEASINEYSYLLPDSSYSIQLGKLGISTAQSELYAKDIRLRPNYRRFAPEKTLWEVQLSKVALSDFDWYPLIFQQQLLARELRLDRALIAQVGTAEIDSSESQELNQFYLYPLVAPFLKQVQLDSLVLSEARWVQLTEPGSLQPMIDVNGIELHLQDFFLDSLTQHDQRLLWSEQIRLKLDEYTFSLSKGGYRLSGEQVALSTQEQAFTGGKIRLEPADYLLKAAEREGRDVLRFGIPGVEIRGLELAEVWYDRILEVERFAIQSPSVELVNFPEVDQRQVDSLAQSDWYDLVDNIFEEVLIKEFQVLGGNFRLDAQGQASAFEASDLRIYIEDFQLNDSARARRDNPFYAAELQIALNISDYSFVLPDSSYAVQIRKLGISAADSAIFADSVFLTPLSPLDQLGNQPQQQVQVFVPHIRLAGLDAAESYFGRNLVLDSLYIKKPLLEIFSFAPEGHQPQGIPSPDSLDLYAPVQELLNAIVVRNIMADSAEVVWHQQRGIQEMEWKAFPIHLRAEDFLLDSLSQLSASNLGYATNVSVSLQAFRIPISDSTHELTIDSSYFSTGERSFFIGEAHVQPLGSQTTRSTTDASLAQFQVHLPGIEARGIDWYRWWKENYLDIDSLAIPQPSLRLAEGLAVDSLQVDSLSRGSWVDQIMKQVDGLQIGHFTINGGKLGVNTEHPSPGNRFQASQVGIAIQDFRLDSNTVQNPDGRFEMESLEVGLKIEDYVVVLPDSSYEIQVGEIAISSRDSSLLAQEVKLLPRKTDPTRAQVQLHIPQVQIRGIRPQEIYVNRELKVSAIEVRRPGLQFQSPSVEAPEKQQGQWYPSLQKQLRLVTSKRIDIQDARITHLAEEPAFEPIQNLSLSLDRFELDSLSWLREERLLYADAVSIQLKDFGFPLGKSPYRLEASRWSYQTPTKELTVDSLRLFNRLTSEEFMAENGYVVDEVSLRSRKLRASPLSLAEIIEDSLVQLNVLSLENLYLEVFKDKTLPIKPDRDPPIFSEWLQGLPFGLNIADSYIRGGQIVYLEKPEAAPQTGFFYLSDLQTHIQDLSNLPQARPKEAETVISTTAYLMGTSRLESVMTYWTADTAERYEMAGSLGPLNLKALNPILEPAASVSIESGQLEGINFEFSANERLSRGKMRMRYEDLQVTILQSKELETSPNKPKRMITALANGLVVQSNNPRRRFLRVGRIRYEIEEDKGFVGHWTQSILSGAKSSIGMEDEDEKDRSQGLRFLRKSSQ